MLYVFAGGHRMGSHFQIFVVTHGLSQLGTKFAWINRAAMNTFHLGAILRGLARCDALPAKSFVGGVETEIAELARTINEIAGNPTPPDIKPARDWDRSGMRYGSTEKSKRDLGFEAKTNIRDGLQKTVGWTRTNKNLVARCIARHARFMNNLGAQT